MLSINRAVVLSSSGTLSDKLNSILEVIEYRPEEIAGGYKQSKCPKFAATFCCKTAVRSSRKAVLQ